MLDETAFAVFAMAALTGMRLAEIQGLKWDCVSFTTGKVTVKRIWDSKAGVLEELQKPKRSVSYPSPRISAQFCPPCAKEERFGLCLPNTLISHHAARTLRAFCRKADKGSSLPRSQAFLRLKFRDGGGEYRFFTLDGGSSTLV